MRVGPVAEKCGHHADRIPLDRPHQRGLGVRGSACAGPSIRVASVIEKPANDIESIAGRRHQKVGETVRLPRDWNGLDYSVFRNRER